MDSLMSPGSQLRLLMDSVGFRENKLGEIIGAVLDSKVANNLGAAQNILDAFAPLTQIALDRLTSSGFAPMGFCRCPHLYRPGFDYSPAQMNRFVGSMLSRCTNAQATSNAIYSIAAALNNSGVNSAGLIPNGSFDVQVSQLMQKLITQMQTAIQQKLNTMTPAPPKKKKKKKGIGAKLKKGLNKVGKGFEKIGKMAKGIPKMGKSLFKGVLKGVKGIFKGGLLKGLFQLGGGLFGGLVGGPLGTNMISKIAGKKNGAKLTQVFGQMTKMFQVVGNIQNGATQFNLQGLAKYIRA
jgi:hypothetical protein